MNQPDQQQDNEDGLEWLRDIRKKMSADCNHDPHVMIEKLRKMEKLPHYAHTNARVRKVLEPVTP